MQSTTAYVLLCKPRTGCCVVAVYTEQFIGAGCSSRRRAWRTRWIYVRRLWWHTSSCRSRHEAAAVHRTAQHSTALSTVTDGASYGRHASPLGTGQGHVTLVPLLNSCLLTDRPHHVSAQIREFWRLPCELRSVRWSDLKRHITITAGLA